MGRKAAGKSIRRVSALYSHTPTAIVCGGRCDLSQIRRSLPVNMRPTEWPLRVAGCWPHRADCGHPCRLSSDEFRAASFAISKRRLRGMGTSGDRWGAVPFPENEVSPPSRRPARKVVAMFPRRSEAGSLRGVRNATPFADHFNDIVTEGSNSATNAAEQKMKKAVSKNRFTVSTPL